MCYNLFRKLMFFYYNLFFEFNISPSIFKKAFGFCDGKRKNKRETRAEKP